VQAVLWNPVVIHKDTIGTLISDRFHTREQIYATGTGDATRAANPRKDD